MDTAKHSDRDQQAGATPLWEPDTTANASLHHMRKFMQAAAQSCNAGLRDWPTLYQWSLQEPAQFWAAVADYAGIHFSRQPTAILETGAGMADARWFAGARLNFAENLLAAANPDAAIVFRDERGRRRAVSRDDLCTEVAGVAAGLRAAGIVQGDRVAAVMPNCPETVIVMLAVASIGAIFSSCSPDFGDSAVVERFGQIEPRLLFVCDGYAYGGKIFACREKAAALASAVASIEQVVVVPFLDARPELADWPRSVLWADFACAGAALEFVQLPFDHPLYILYSSGTTGKPKCIVHGAGGTLLQHQKELLLHTNLQPADVIFYYTTCGWMMWNWLVSALATGATVVLYDGSPFQPDAAALWRLAAEEGVTVFGTSPRFLVACAKAGLRPAAEHNLVALRTILSTGAPLAAESFDYVAGAIGTTVQLCSISGGTDLISCFALGNPLLPVWRGELQSPGLGMAVAVFAPDGQPLTTGPGELVCTQPFPSMPLEFWNDPDGSQYGAAYFARFPGVWAHGDYAEWTAHGGLRILGRSDAVLNPGGVRIGSAEITEPALSVPAVVEALAVGQQLAGDEQIILFVVLRAGIKLDDALRAQIGAAIRHASSPRHVPARICAVPEIPRTLSGKPVELAVKAMLEGNPVTNLEAIANPQALAFFRNLPAD